MLTIPFDVNDNTLRDSFFNRHVSGALAGLNEQAAPLWGKMKAQHVVEHLDWAFQCSTGRLVLPCHTPDSLLERVKRFLYDNRPTPRGFRNPELGADPPPLHFSSFADAKASLQKEANHFLDHFRERPDAVHVHPIFGPLGAEEWHRSHFKHCYHHLLQFRLIEEPPTVRHPE